MRWYTELKIVCATVLTGIFAYLRMIEVPISVLLTFMLLDYVTGLTAAWVNCRISSRMSILGIIKKVMYLALIAVGIGADWVIKFGLSAAKIQLEYGYFIGLLITIWLILNELISILENIGEIDGIEYPGFLKDILSHIKKSIEQNGENNAKN